MKITLILFTILAASIAHAKYVPTPDMAMSIPFQNDTTKWSMQFMDGDRTKIIAEFTPEGQSIKAWKEMLAQEITFTKNSLNKHLNAWKAMILKADPNVIITEKKKEDKLAIYTYKSKLFNEFSIRIFMKGSDGIYAQAYHIRLSEMNKERVELWTKLIPQTTLSPNPHIK